MKYNPKPNLPEHFLPLVTFHSYNDQCVLLLIEFSKRGKDDFVWVFVKESLNKNTVFNSPELSLIRYPEVPWVP